MCPFTATVRRDLISVILSMLFLSQSSHSLINIDLMLQSHGSICHLDWVINTLFELIEYKYNAAKIISIFFSQEAGASGNKIEKEP